MRLLFRVNLILANLRSWPRVHKAFQNQDQDQGQVKHSSTMDFFKTYYNYLTIECWYLIKYVLQTRLLGLLR